MHAYMEFEKPLAELEGKIKDLKALAQGDPSINVAGEVERLEARAAEFLASTYASLDPWQKTQVARHPGRPHFLDYVRELIEGFTPLAGDRAFAEDAAIVGGPGWLQGRAVMIMGHEKGADTASRVRHNFGMASPEGYRKAARLMSLADRFSLPVITLIDTPGAYPGIGAEERGQAEAIARAIDQSLSLSVPSIAVVIGEGGSGGALALATADRVIMLEHSIYTVASPEACASIIWRDAANAKHAAAALKVDSASLLEMGVVDQVLPEPLGGVHRAPGQAMAAVGAAIEQALRDSEAVPPGARRASRREKFMRMGSAPDA